MTMVRDQLQGLIGQLSNAGQSVQEQMAQTLLGFMEQTQQRQSEINQGIAATLDQVRQTMERSQGDAEERMAVAVDGFSEHFGRLVDEMQRRQEQSQETGAQGMQSLVETVRTLAQDIRHSSDEGADASRTHLLKLLDESGERQQRLSDQVRETLDSMQMTFHQTTTAIHTEQQVAQAQTQTFVESGVKVHMNELLNTAKKTNQAIEALICQIGDAMTRTVERLSNDTNRVEGAAQIFVQASEEMARTLHAQEDFHSRVERLVTVVAQSATNLETAANGQRVVHEQTSALLEQLNQITRNQEAQTVLSQEVIKRMEEATEGFKLAADEADKFANNVGQVLGESFKQFHTHMQTNLNKQLTDLDAKLASTLSHLDGHMGRFGDQVEGFSELLDTLERQSMRKN